MVTGLSAGAAQLFRPDAELFAAAIGDGGYTLLRSGWRVAPWATLKRAAAEKGFSRFPGGPYCHASRVRAERLLRIVLYMG